MEREIGEKGRRVRGKIVDSVVNGKLSLFIELVEGAAKGTQLLVTFRCSYSHQGTITLPITHLLSHSFTHSQSLIFSVTHFLSHSHTSLTDWIHHIH